MPDNFTNTPVSPIPPVSPTPPLPPIQPVSPIPPVPPVKKTKTKTILAVLVFFFILASVPVAVFLAKQRQEVRKEAEEGWWVCTPNQWSTGFTIKNTQGTTRHLACIEKKGQPGTSGDDATDGCKCPGIPEGGCNLGHNIIWDKRLGQNEQMECAYASPPSDCGVFQLDVIEESPDGSGNWTEAVGNCYFVTNNCQGNWQERCGTLPTPTPTPTVSPRACNYGCSSIEQCQATNPEYECVEPINSAGTVCRNHNCNLEVNCICPTTTVTPTPGPLSCVSLTKNNNLLIQKTGDILNLICKANSDPVQPVNHFEFRVSVNSGTPTPLPSAAAQAGTGTGAYQGTVNYTIPAPGYGCYTVECRACTSANSTKCTVWGQIR